MQQRPWTICLGILAILVLALSVREWSLLPDGRLHLTFFDVGQGDAALITLPSGNRLVVDGGPDGRLLEHIGRTLPFMNRRVDILVLSHPNLDHIASLPEVLRRYRVGTVLLSISGGTLPTMGEFRSVATSRNVELTLLHAGQVIALPDGVSMTVLWPPAHPATTFTKDVNDLCLVFSLEYRGHRALFTGDISERVESVLVRAKTDLQAELLKVAHHGSISASSDLFLRQVQPTTAVVSAGAGNAYGHPRDEVLQRLTALGTRILRTDVGGTQEVIW